MSADGTRPPRGRRRVVVTALGAACVVASTVSLAASGGDGEAPPPNRLSNTGAIVSSSGWTEAQRALVGQLRPSAAVAVLARRDGRAFYRISESGRPDCFATGPAGGARDGEFGTLGCVHEQAADGSLTVPLLDMSHMALDPASGTLTLVSGEGFAADHIATVDVVDVRGAVVTTTVAGNVYRFPDDTMPVRDPLRLVGRNAAGEDVGMLPLVARGVAALPGAAG